MNIDLIMVGKTDSDAVASLVEEYMKRVNFYSRFALITVPDPRRTKKLSASEQKAAEAVSILKNISPGDYVVLLDEVGSQFSSVEFASWIQKRMNSGLRRLVFVIGGPYGFDRTVRERADDVISLSRMTFSHQIVRAIFLEQLYRGLSILAGDPYHHQ